MSLTKLTTNLNNIQALPDKPLESDGYTAALNKLKFDKAGNDIKTYINDTLTPELDIKFTAIDGDIGDKDLLNTTDKTNVIAAINEHEARLDAADVVINQHETRLDNIDTDIVEVNSQLAQSIQQINTNTTNIASHTSQIASLASAAPKAVSLVSQMTDTTKNYVYTGSEGGYTAGNWYYYNGSAWASGGVYQATSIANDSVGFEQLKGDYLTLEKSWNIFNKINALDGKLVGNTPNTNIQSYADSIYSGIVPVESGKTYIISQKLRPVGAIFCYGGTVTSPNFNTGAICAIDVLGGAYGTWGSPTSKITRVNNALSGEYYSTVITISDPNIKFIAWHMHGGSYWSHTTEQFNTLIDSTQAEEGNVRNTYTSYGWEIYKINEASLPEEFKKLQNNDVVVLKTGSKISARVRFDDTKDIYHLWEYPITNNNQGLNLIDIVTCDNTSPYDTLSGTSLKTSGDDIAPLYLNTSYVGANHGYFDVVKLTATAHGKTTVDIGSVWSLNSKNFIILDIVDANTLKIFSDFTGNQISPVNYTSAVSFSGTLIHVSGATNTTNIAFTATVKEQLYPNTNNKQIKLVLDGKELIDDGVYYGDKFDLIEIYNITDIPSIQQYIKNNLGTKADLSSNAIAGWVTVTNVFSHNKNGSLTIKTGYEYLKQTSIQFYGVTQSFSIGTKAYVPDVGIVDGKDMSTVVTQGTNTLDFTKATWLSATKPPYRYHQFSDDLTKGMALGYNTSFGIAKPLLRQNDSGAGNYMGSTKKMYPYVKVGGSAVEGDYHEVIAFRVPLRVIDTDATCLYWYWVGEDIYLAFDYHKNIDKIIALPSYMAGKKIEQIDVHANTTIQSEFVSAKGIKVKVINNYGYGVLRLYD